MIHFEHDGQHYLIPYFHGPGIARWPPRWIAVEEEPTLLEVKTWSDTYLVPIEIEDVTHDPNAQALSRLKPYLTARRVKP